MTKGDDYASEAAQRVRQDIEEGFKDALLGREGEEFSVGLHDSDLQEHQALATSNFLVVVPWVYPCTHIGDFLNIPATFLPLDLRGATFVDIRENGDWTYYRYIDYIGALHQIGVSTDSRPVVANDEA